jgi:hypothetical protein
MIYVSKYCPVVSFDSCCVFILIAVLLFDHITIFCCYRPIANNYD